MTITRGVLHFRISESIIRFNRPTSDQTCHFGLPFEILTISAKVSDVIKKGVSVWTSVRSTHTRPCDFQRKRHAASGIATVLQFRDSFYQYSSFLGLCHMNQPFLKTPRRSNFWLFRNPKSSGISDFWRARSSIDVAFSRKATLHTTIQDKTR